MFTTDYALTKDDAYLEIVKDYANSLDSLSNSFSHAWAKLVTSGGFWADNMFCFDPDSFEVLGGKEMMNMQRISGIKTA